MLVAYASRHGATREIAEAIAAALLARGVTADARDVATIDGLEPYDAVVLGSAVYFGKWLEPARAFAAHRWDRGIEEGPHTVVDEIHHHTDLTVIARYRMFGTQIATRLAFKPSCFPRGFTSYLVTFLRGRLHQCRYRPQTDAAFGGDRTP